jgi:putative ABC transport system permease protein
MSLAVPSTGGLAFREQLRLALVLARRDLRGGLAGFAVFIGCIALGVAAIVGVASISRGLTDGLADQGRVILGGDLAFNLVQREAAAEERQFLESRGKVDSVANMRAMARSEGGDAALVEMKAVEPAYPIHDALITNPAMTAAALFENRNGRFGATAEPALFARLNVKVGDVIYMGETPLELRAELVTEPDKLAAGVGFGPRLMISQEALAASKLIQPGSLVRWSYRVTLPPNLASEADVTRLENDLKARYPQGGFETRSRSNASPGFQRNLERFTQFLTLVGFTALLVGGVGVANAARAFVDRKRVPFATLKSLGARGGFVFLISLMQVLALSSVGIVLGLIIGAAAPYLIAWLAGAIIPFPLDPNVYPRELALGVLYGVLATLAFSIGPLGSSHDIPVSALFRDVIAGEKRKLRPAYAIAVGLAVTVLAGVAVAFAFDQRIALIYIGGAAITFMVLRLVGEGVMAIARRLPRPRQSELRLALANTHRPGALTPSVVLSLGLGVTLVVALTLVDTNIRTQLTRNLPEQAPSFFFVDIRKADLQGFTSFLQDKVPTAKIDTVPMLRGRVVSLKGIPAEDYPATEGRWVLEGDRGITYAETLPAGSTITSGEWWPKDYAGPNLVSFAREEADELGLKVGDKLVVNVLGRNTEATIANLRDVEWRSMGINFVMVFSPNAFSGAPYTSLATLAFDKSGAPANEMTLLRDVAAAFPAVTSVRVKDALDAVNEVVGQLANAIRGASAIALIASVLVLGGALAAGHRARVYDAVVLKTLGATRKRLLTAFVLEYSMVGFAAALFGFAAGAACAWLLVTMIMELDFALFWSSAVIAMLIALSITILLGLAQTWHILGQKPASYLRSL